MENKGVGGVSKFREGGKMENGRHQPTGGRTYNKWGLGSNRDSLHDHSRGHQGSGLRFLPGV